MFTPNDLSYFKTKLTSTEVLFSTISGALVVKYSRLFTDTDTTYDLCVRY